MNPRLTDIPLHADPVHESGLPVDYYQADDFGKRWFHFFLGFCVGMGFATLLFVSMYGGRL